jgi:NADH-quinone oxidoreductase subunit N
MTASDLLPMLPMIIIAFTTVFILILVAFQRNHSAAYFCTLAGIAAAFFSIPLAGAQALSGQPLPLLVIDAYALLYTGLFLASVFAVAVLSQGYLKTHAGQPEEFYVLLLGATLGATILTASNHFASLFLGIEAMSIPLYALIAYPHRDSRNIEAGLKYLILSAVSVSFLLFGMALIYFGQGSLEFSVIAGNLSDSVPGPLILAGTAMVIVGIGFKLAVVPFHMWTPDVYEGAPAPVTAFVAAISKGAVFVVLIRYFSDVQFSEDGTIFFLFTILATASMFVGNLLALFQNNLKRLLAYSSIAHFGYLLVAFLSAAHLRTAAVAYYLVAYFIATLGAFGVLTVMSRQEEEVERIDDCRGLFARKPWLAITFTLMLLSLAGIPLTAGFIGKFLVMTAGIGSALSYLVIILAINSAMGLFYYLRVIAALFASAGEAATSIPTTLSRGGCVVIRIMAAFLVFWGIFPGSLLNLILSMTAGTAGIP